MKAIQLFILLAFTLFLYSCDKPEPLGGASATYTFYGKDQNKKAPKNFNELPTVIQDSANSYMKSRLGPTVFTKFKYVGGRIIQRELLSPGLQTDATIPDYVLHFNITNDTIDYTACLLLSARGNIITDLDFPNTGKLGDNFSILSEDKAIEIAVRSSKKKGSRYNGSFQFDNDKRTFVWVVDIMMTNSNVTHKYDIVKINAQSGEVLEQRQGLYYSY